MRCATAGSASARGLRITTTATRAARRAEEGTARWWAAAAAPRRITRGAYGPGMHHAFSRFCHPCTVSVSGTDVRAHPRGCPVPPFQSSSLVHPLFSPTQHNSSLTAQPPPLRRICTRTHASASASTPSATKNRPPYLQNFQPSDHAATETGWMACHRPRPTLQRPHRGTVEGPPQAPPSYLTLFCSQFPLFANTVSDFSSHLIRVPPHPRI